MLNAQKRITVSLYLSGRSPTNEKIVTLHESRQCVGGHIFQWDISGGYIWVIDRYLLEYSTRKLLDSGRPYYNTHTQKQIFTNKAVTKRVKTPANYFLNYHEHPTIHRYHICISFQILLKSNRIIIAAARQFTDPSKYSIYCGRNGRIYQKRILVYGLDLMMRWYHFSISMRCLVNKWKIYTFYLYFCCSCWPCNTVVDFSFFMLLSSV